MKIKITENQLKSLIKIISEQEERKLNVLFVGDSLSAGEGWTWNYLLAKKHSNEWNTDHLWGGGQPTIWMLNNLKSKLIEKKYDLVFIYGGTNDMFSLISINNALANIQKMVDLVNQQGGKAYVFSGYDAESVMTDNVLRETRLCDMNCMKRGRDRMIEFQSKLQQPSTIQNAVIIPTILGDSYWTNDGTHPGGPQNIMMAEHVDNYIKNESKSSTNIVSKFIDDLKNLVNNKFLGGYKLTDELLETLEKFKNSNETIEYDGDIISNDYVAPIQTTLQSLGFSLPIYGVDGLFGPETENATQKFQKANNLNDDGVVNKETIQKLIDEFESKNISDDDLKDIQIEKTSFLPKSSGVNSSKKITSTDVVGQLKEVIENNGLSFEDFKRELDNIGLDVKIAAKQISVESMNFNPSVINCDIVSPKGAMGLTQFIPITWDQYGKGGDPCNVKDSLAAYIRLMTDIMKMFPGRPDLAVAGYNSGPNLAIYKKALRDDLSFDEIKSSLPLETRGYVNTIFS